MANRQNMTIEQILDLEMKDTDIGDVSIQEYLGTLLLTVLEEQEGFSGKRPFGNSGWYSDLCVPLVKADLIDGKLDDDGYLDEADQTQAGEILRDCVFHIFDLEAVDVDDEDENEIMEAIAECLEDDDE